MKNLMFCLALWLLASATEAQNLRDVVYLKNGSIIKGVITEQNPPVQIKLQTADGSMLVYKYEEIEKLTREPIEPVALKEPNFREYGGHFGLGFALGGGGIIGVPIRANINRFVALETGVYFRPTIVYKKTTTYNGWGNEVSQREETDIKVPPMIAGGVDIFFGEKYRKYSQKIVKNGIAIRVGATILKNHKENMLCLGWARERFKVAHKKYSYNFNLGAGALFYDAANYPLADQLGTAIPIMPFVYWKFHWNWYIGK